MVEFFKDIFSSEGFMPHGHCLLWKPTAVWLHVVSDSIITLAYYSIPIILLYFVHKRRDLAFQWIFLMFGAFIFGCGTTHLMGIWTLWVPAYWVDGGIKAITALLSLATAVLLVPLVPKVLSLRSPAELEVANRELEKQITERGQAEEALRRAHDELERRVEERTAELVKANAELQRQAQLLDLACVLVRDMNSRIIFWNSGTEEMYGWTKADTIGHISHTLLQTQFPKSLQQIEAELLRDGHWEGELVHTKRDGTCVVVASRWVLRRDEQGTPIAILEVSNDISEAKKAEEALRENQATLDGIIASAMDTIITVDADQCIILFNAAAERMFRCSAGEVIGQPLDRFIPERFRTMHREHIRIFSQTGVTTRKMGALMSISGLRADGEEFPIEASISQIETGGQRFFTVILRDITERQRAEEEIHKLNEELEQRVIERTAQLEAANRELQNEMTERKRAEETIKDSLTQLSKKNRYETIISTVTQSVHQSINLQDVLENAVEAISKNIDVVDIIGILLVEGEEAVLKAHRGYPDWFLERVVRIPYPKGFTWKTIMEGKSSYIADVDQDSVIGPYGREVGTKSYLSIPIHHEGKTVGVININSFKKNAFDREDLKLLEIVTQQIEVAFHNAQIAETLWQSEQEIRKLNKELEKRLTELTTVNKELEAFSYSVSHDLRAPLRAIDGFSRILFENYSDKLDDEGKRTFNIILSNAQKMGQLIDDLLAFSRLGRQDIRLSNLDIGELAKVVFEEIKLNNTHHKTPQLNINTIPPAYGDRALIRQVFVNLLSNAIKFTKPKEMAIIEVGSQVEGKENIYYVRDNGAGFDMQYVNKLFGVFQRLHRQDEFEGTGVGLAIVQRIIHRHGGRVWAEGKVGEGATFYFTIPREGGNIP